MHENNIPGCVVTEKLLRQIAAESQSADKGKQARLDRAAKMYAISKGMGYKGAYIMARGFRLRALNISLPKETSLFGIGSI